MSEPTDHEHVWKNAGEIDSITWDDIDGPQFARVGRDGVTRIEKAVKTGEMSYIPYVRVWRGDVAISEHSQHKLSGVYFKTVQP